MIFFYGKKSIKNNIKIFIHDSSYVKLVPQIKVTVEQQADIENLLSLILYL